MASQPIRQSRRSSDLDRSQDQIPVGGRGMPTSRDREKERKLDRKRAQNRLSQKLFREKQAAYIQQLEQSLEIALAKNSSRSPETQTRDSDYFARENAVLRTALLRARKGFLVVGETVSKYAADVALQNIGNGTLDDSEAHGNAWGSMAATLLNGSSQQPIDSSMDFDQSPQPALCTPRTDTQSCTKSRAFPEPNDILISTTGVQTCNRSPPDTAANFPKEQDFVEGDTFHGAVSVCSPEQQLGVGKGSKYSALCFDEPSLFTFSETIEAMSKMIDEVLSIMNIHSLRWRALGNNTPCTRLAESSDELQMDKDTVYAVITQAWKVMQKAQRLDKYIYALGSARTLRQIMIWRFRPTEEHRLLIPEPLRPTALQVKIRESTNYSRVTTDFIPWPSMRDQMLENIGMFDENKFAEDFMEYVTVENVELGVCYRTMDIHIELLEIWSVTGIGMNGDESIEEGIVHITNPDHKLAMQLACNAGITRYAEYKLLPAFSALYPFLDLKSG